MSSSDPRRFNPMLTIHKRNDVRRSIAKAEAEQNDLRQSIVKAGAELQRLLLRRNQVWNNVLRLKQTLVIHRILPTEIMDYVFTILRAETVSIPHNQNMIPSQITVSHVCSRWREIALATPALWSDVEITKPECNKWIQVATELLFDRASTQGVNLTLNMEQTSVNKMEEIFYDIVLPLRVKKLHLTLPLFTLDDLSERSNDIIANIDEIGLSFKFDYPPIDDEVSITSRFLSKIRSLTVLKREKRSSLITHLNFIEDLRWAQMRHLCCNIPIPLYAVSDILSQSPFLNVCGIQVELDDDDYGYDEEEPTTVLTLPQLRIFHIFVHHLGSRRSNQDRVLRSFKCPDLTDFRLEIPYWTPETYKIVQNHYNLHRLLRFKTSNYPYPISKVLSDAPMLQELMLSKKVFIDERALHGVASGMLGRCLTMLGFEGYFNEKRVLDMVASRQRNVKQVVEASRSWQDQQISGIKQIFLLNDDDDDDDVKDIALVGLEVELKKLGVTVYRSSEHLNSHPLSVLGE